MSSSTEKKPVRNLAADVLDKMGADYCKGNSAELVSEVIELTGERQRLTDLVFGTIRSRYTLDCIIEKISGQAVKRIQKKILNVLRIGVYELVFNNQTPVYAVINEAVEAVKKKGGRKQRGFVNAVLREVERSITERRVDYEGTPDSRLVPTGWNCGCKFKQDILPDYDKDQLGYFCSGYSLPEFLISEWLDDFDVDTVRRICAGSNRSPSIYLRVNRSKIGRDEFADRLNADGIETEPVGEGEMVRVTSPANVSEIRGYDEGLFSVQDLTAYSVIEFMSAKPEDNILDFCAAPGGKATGIAELANDQAEIIATDIDAKRLEQVKESADRLALKSIKTVDYNSLLSDQTRKKCFARVLADVPCSNSGVLARRAEARYRIDKGGVKQLAGKQLDILHRASEFVKPGGIICYSTCSILEEENRKVIERFSKKRDEFSEIKARLFLPYPGPGFDYDGGFACLLRRSK